MVVKLAVGHTKTTFQFKANYSGGIRTRLSGLENVFQEERESYVKGIHIRRF